MGTGYGVPGCAHLDTVRRVRRIRGVTRCRGPCLVFAPAPILTVTVEQKGSDDDVHVHAGGQGFWIARMLATLDVPVVL
jgi:hypothetical protein